MLRVYCLNIHKYYCDLQTCNENGSLQSHELAIRHVTCEQSMQYKKIIIINGCSADGRSEIGGLGGWGVEIVGLTTLWEENMGLSLIFDLDFCP